MAKDPSDLAQKCLRPIRACATDEQYQDAVANILSALSDAFDAGFKAAGGSMIPDGARNMVELSLDRDQIDVLANAAEVCSFGTGVKEVALSFDRPGEQDAMKRFLETISIYRRKQ
jgi:hypothetical protein